MIEFVRTPIVFAAEMEEICNLEDTWLHDEERVHVEADKLMCDLLTSLGYGEGVKIFENTDKWYA